jgi:hypothetical protein
MYVSLGLLDHFHNSDAPKLQYSLFRRLVHPKGTFTTEILTKATILNRTFDELGQPEKANALWRSCERLSQWRFTLGPTQIVDLFQHVPIKVGRFLVERTNRCEVDAVVTPRHLDNGERSQAGQMMSARRKLGSRRWVARLGSAFDNTT